MPPENETVTAALPSYTCDPIVNGNFTLSAEVADAALPVTAKAEILAGVMVTDVLAVLLNVVPLTVKPYCVVAVAVPPENETVTAELPSYTCDPIVSACFTLSAERASAALPVTANAPIPAGVKRMSLLPSKSTPAIFLPGDKIPALVAVAADPAEVEKADVLLEVTVLVTVDVVLVLAVVRISSQGPNVGPLPPIPRL